MTLLYQKPSWARMPRSQNDKRGRGERSLEPVEFARRVVGRAPKVDSQTHGITHTEAKTKARKQHAIIVLGEHHLFFSWAFSSGNCMAPSIIHVQEKKV